ncbi:hypothetical protein [Natrinema hispanicum]|uniref:Uncharacterized protein n=1 Tax=Natrinema hispanicum TaxID=392421 RepID=A0A1G6UXL2_9EURY|nr:hypothetical protein [Natrinema hispanicum]SDD46028.1 hypothetical protein SAMN05192552_102417 [Natrinema hispanicum]
MSDQQTITLGGILVAVFVLDIFVFGWVLVDEPVLQQIAETTGMIVTPAA